MRKAIRCQADRFEQVPATHRRLLHRAPGDSRATSPVGVVRTIGLRRTSRAWRSRNRSLLLTEAASVYPGVENLLLAARALGLGATVTLWHLRSEREVAAVLGLPADVRIFALVPIGRPLGRFGAVRRRPVDEVLHWERWTG